MAIVKRVCCWGSSFPAIQTLLNISTRLSMSMLCRNILRLYKFDLALLISVNRCSAVRHFYGWLFNKISSWGEYTILNTNKYLLDSNSFFFCQFVFKMVYVKNFGGKNSSGNLLKIFVKKGCPGKLCANVFQFSRQKS